MSEKEKIAEELMSQISLKEMLPIQKAAELRIQAFNKDPQAACKKYIHSRIYDQYDQFDHIVEKEEKKQGFWQKLIGTKSGRRETER